MYSRTHLFVESNTWIKAKIKNPEKKQLTMYVKYDSGLKTQNKLIMDKIQWDPLIKL